MTTLEDFYFGNVTPSEYRQRTEVRKNQSAMTVLMEELSCLMEKD